MGLANACVKEIREIAYPVLILSDLNCVVLQTY